MSRYRRKATPKAIALDIEVQRRYREGVEKHEPDRPSYARVRGRGVAKWACRGCDYWTGYESRAKAARLILQHADRENGKAAA